MAITTSGYIYWTDQGSDKIQRSLLDGSNISDLQTGLNTPKGLDLFVANNHIYWTDPTVSYIRRCDFNGSNVVPIISGLTNNFQGLAIDETNGYIYSCGNRPGSERIARCDLDGSNLNSLISTGLSDPIDIALDIVNNKFYWTDITDKYIGYANLDGSSSGILVAGLSAPFNLTVDTAGDKLYWTNGSAAIVGDGSIQRCDQNGSNVEILISGLHRPHGLALDLTNSKIYFTEVILGTINRCDLDGSNLETMISGLVNPQWIHIRPEVSIPIIPTGIPGIITRWRRTHSYHPQLISTFTGIPISVNIQIWDIGDGQNNEITVTNSGCYRIGNTSKWAWSTQNLPFIHGHKQCHYYFRMVSNTNEEQFGEFTIVAPEN